MDYPFRPVIENWPMFVQGLVMTLQISLTTLILSLSVGTLVGVMRVSPSWFLRALSRIYVEAFRNVPPLILIFFCYFGLPRAGVVLSAFLCAALALTLYHGAFIGEIVRGGIEAVGRHQLEAARSLGLTYVQSFRRVVLPQAFAVVIPSIGTLFVGLTKTTSLVATIALVDIMHQAEVLNSITFRPFEVFSFAGLLYLGLSMSLGHLSNVLEAKLTVHRGRPA